MTELEGQVGATVDLIGVLVALVTLFTLEQQRRLDQERLREGGASRKELDKVRNLTIGLGLVTGLATGILAPLFYGALRTFSLGAPTSAVLSVFVLVWLLLVALLIWQISLIKSAW